MFPVLVMALRRDGGLGSSEEEAKLLCQMSPATIDRRLASARRLPMARGRTPTRDTAQVADPDPYLVGVG
jgi:hypothetical protein